jgi:hypothetical protein
MEPGSPHTGTAQHTPQPTTALKSTFTHITLIVISDQTLHTGVTGHCRFSLTHFISKKRQKKAQQKITRPSRRPYPPHAS